MDEMARPVPPNRGNGEAERLKSIGERQSFLLTLSDTLRTHDSEQAIEAESLRLLAEHLHLDRAYVARVDRANDRAEIGPESRLPDLKPVAGVLRMSDFPDGFAQVEDRTLVVEDIAHDASLSELDRTSLGAIDLIALIVASARVGEGNPVWSLVAGNARPRRWTDVEVALVEDVAERTWAAVERARAGAAAKTAEQRYLALFNSIDQGFCTIEVAFDEDDHTPVDYRFLEVSPSFERQTGIVNAAGRWMREIAADQDEFWFDIYGRVARTGESIRFESFSTPLDRWWSVYAFKIEGPDRVAVLFHDITDRKRAEEALQQSETRQAFLLKLSDAIRPVGDTSALRGLACRLLGEHLGVPRVYYVEHDGGEHCEVVSDDYRAAGLPSLAGRYPFETFRTTYEHVSGGRTWVVEDVAREAGLAAHERQFFAANGVISWVNVPLVKAGRFEALLCVVDSKPRVWPMLDIDIIEATAERLWAAVERARAESARHDSEERFRQFSENTGDVLWIVNATTRELEYLSPAFERVWGEGRERVSRDLALWAETIHPDDRDRALQGMPRLFAGQRFTQEYRIIRPDGEMRWVRDSGFPIFDSEGRVSRAAGIAQDITPVREAAEALSETEHRFRTLSEGIPQLVWRASDYGIWSWASPQWTDYTGQSDEESWGWGWLDPVHPDDRDTARAAWTQARNTGVFDVEYRIRHAADGAYRWFQTRATPVHDSAGRVIEWLGTSTDVDDLRALQRRQQLLLAELQHRVRNTLGVVKSVARRTAETSRNVDELAAHLDGRIEAFSRVQSAVTRDPSGGVDLTALIEDELLAYATREGRQLSIHGPRTKLMPRAAETISLAVHELATNAVKHGALAAPHGQIDVRWSCKDGDFLFSWKEFGLEEGRGKPNRPGFGMGLLLNNLPYDLDAETHAEFEPNGMRFTLRAPLKMLLSEELGALDLPR